MPPQYPGHNLKVRVDDRQNVTAVQQQLNKRGCGPVEEDGVFGTKTDVAVRLFQSRFTDARGMPLRQDGIVGAITWEALFGMTSIPRPKKTTNRLIREALATATSQIGVMEKPPGSNRGPEVDQYVKSVGLEPEDQNPWCAAFVYWSFNQASAKLQRLNPLVKTGSVMEHWRKAGEQGISRISTDDAVEDPTLVEPGMIFILSCGGGQGHTGLVERVNGGMLVTIEGNTNEGGSRQGIGVFRREGRKILSINRGFICYS